MNITVAEVPPLRIAAVSHADPYDLISEAFHTPSEKLRSDAGVIVPDGARLPVEVAEKRFPGGRYACATQPEELRTDLYVPIG